MCINNLFNTSFDCRNDADTMMPSLYIICIVQLDINTYNYIFVWFIEFSWGKIWLFFGCRQKTLDLYRDEKNTMIQESVLDREFLALSREVGHKRVSFIMLTKYNDTHFKTL